MPPKAPPTQSPLDPPVSPAGAAPVAWHLRSGSGLKYSFQGVAALRKWATNFHSKQDLLVSTDGREWKSYEGFERGLLRTQDPVRAFQEAGGGPLPDASERVETESADGERSGGTPATVPATEPPAPRRVAQAPVRTNPPPPSRRSTGEERARPDARTDLIFRVDSSSSAWPGRLLFFGLGVFVGALAALLLVGLGVLGPLGAP